MAILTRLFLISGLLLAFSVGFSYAQTDTLTNTGGDDPNEIDTLDNAGLYKRNDSLSLKILTFPGLSTYQEWNTNVIYNRKYDFSYVLDTLRISLLNDSLSERFVVPYKGNVTSIFGPRKYRYHYGVDIKLQTGDSVAAAFDGTVRISHRSKTYGNVIVVRHKNGLETFYAHLSKSFVEPNKLVKAGDIIGLGGNTGRSYGSHLHFEIRYLDEPINPCDVVDFTNKCLKSDTLVLTKTNFCYMEQVREFDKIKFHTIRKGDTLSGIAVKYGTSVSTLCKLNGITTKKILRIGQKIRVK
jgi:murein DD-endopeptidase MepM/ murein hydrolase activator NlpD